MFDGDDETQEEIITLKMDSTVKDVFKDKTLPEFWIDIAFSYPKVANKAIRHLMPFPSTYLCETGFSALLGIKSKHRNKLQVEADMRCSLSATIPHIDSLVAKMQHQPSH